MPSRISGHRRTGRAGFTGLAGFAGLVLTVGLALTGCDPSAAGGGATASARASATATVAAGPTSSASSAPLAPLAPVTPVTPQASSAAPAAAQSQPTTSTAPQPKVTTAKPPADPEPEHTAAAGGAGCDIRSNAGNCYEAGQFCRNGDLGKSTHDAAGRVITCRMVSGKPHWQA
ncbi:hypothetical protein [Kitasatospora sp. NPDC086791]|uniref:hypothetical protein n=1 Tax=Kitasatospora sp. NPDC086791 TaxID=3155178 RepID=UPI00343EB292